MEVSSDFILFFSIIKYLKCINKMLHCKNAGVFFQSEAGSGAKLKYNRPG